MNMPRLFLVGSDVVCGLSLITLGPRHRQTNAACLFALVFGTRVPQQLTLTSDGVIEI